MSRLLFLSLFVVALPFTLGCGDKDPAVNYVEGVVTLDGRPLEGAQVIFSPVEGSGGRPATGVTDSAGVYKLTDLQANEMGRGAAAGEYRVAINKAVGGDTAAGLGEGGEMIDDEAEQAGSSDPTAPVTLKSAVPDKYTRADSSGLTATISEGRNENVDFELSST